MLNPPHSESWQRAALPVSLVRTDTVPPLVAPERLARAERILFITHLAIGDYAYLQGCLRAFAIAYPHIQIHLWVDERRRTADPEAWPALQKYALYDWLAACPWIAKVYNETYSPATLDRSIGEAQRHAYPIVASLAVVDCHRYARLARSISPDGFVVGLKKPAERWLHAPSRLAAYRKMDAAFPVYGPAEQASMHISDIYAGWFARCFGLDVPMPMRRPELDIPPRWQREARAQLVAWDFVDGQALVFLNATSKCADRTWPLERALALIDAMRTRGRWRDAGFVVNVMPESLDEAQRLLGRRHEARRAGIRLFSAHDHFFQLPALMSLCNLVISVETAVMHLANAVQVPVVALMRRNHPEWAPIDKARSTVVMVPRYEDWVTAIDVEDVMAVLDA
jgi:ADP-heptose:LPS heptosyltransferase